MVLNGSQWLFSLIFNDCYWSWVIYMILNHRKWFWMLLNDSQWFSLIDNDSQWWSLTRNEPALGIMQNNCQWLRIIRNRLRINWELLTIIGNLSLRIIKDHWKSSWINEHHWNHWESSLSISEDPWESSIIIEKQRESPL